MKLCNTTWFWVVKCVISVRFISATSSWLIYLRVCYVVNTASVIKIFFFSLVITHSFYFKLQFLTLLNSIKLFLFTFHCALVLWFIRLIKTVSVFNQILITLKIIVTAAELGGLFTRRRFLLPTFSSSKIFRLSRKLQKNGLSPGRTF